MDPEETVQSNMNKGEFEQKTQDVGSAILEDLFALGYTKSPIYTIYKDEKSGVRIEVQYRNLIPREIRDVSEMCDRWHSELSRLLTEQLETLARAIITINGMPLLLSTEEQEKFRNEHEGKYPTALDQARICLVDKIKSEYVIDALWDGYQDFREELKNHFDEVKKKLKTPASSS